MQQHGKDFVANSADDLDVAHAARTYLRHGPAPLSELVRVLTDHLEVFGRERVAASVVRLINTGALRLTGANVSLPSGGGQREIKEHGA
jgi:hypothetical protein